MGKANYHGLVDGCLYAVTHKPVDEARIRQTWGPAGSSTCPDAIQAFRAPGIAYGCPGTPFEFERDQISQSIEASLHLLMLITDVVAASYGPCETFAVGPGMDLITYFAFY